MRSSRSRSSARGRRPRSHASRCSSPTQRRRRTALTPQRRPSPPHRLSPDGRRPRSARRGGRRARGRRARARTKGRRRPLAVYAGSIIAISLALVAGAALDAQPARRLAWWGEVLFGSPCCWDPAAGGLAGQLDVHLFVDRSRWARMDYLYASHPNHAPWSSCRRCAATRRVEALVDALECAFSPTATRTCTCVAERFYDASEEHQPADASLVELAALRISALNRNTGRRARRHRLIFCSIGRGAGIQASGSGGLRAQARQAGGPQCACCAVTPAKARRSLPAHRWRHRLLSAVRYVITLDTDTQLPRDAASQIIATMAHPLKRPGVRHRPLRGHRRRVATASCSRASA